MSTTVAHELTVSELHAMFGPMPARRIRQHPAPGTGRVAHVVALLSRKVRCELIDGVLVEKAMGFEESLLAARLLMAIGAFVELHRLGKVAGEAGTIQLSTGSVRIPDVAYYSNARMKERTPRRSPVPRLVPNLAAEVLSVSNTAAEMDRKRKDYFAASVELVWYVDPVTRTVDVWTEVEAKTTLAVGKTLQGGTVLPGFELPLQELFSVLDD